MLYDVHFSPASPPSPRIRGVTAGRQGGAAFVFVILFRLFFDFVAVNYIELMAKRRYSCAHESISF